LLTGCSALVLTACGGDEKQVRQRSVSGPTIERSLAERLAARSESVARMLEKGDACAASQEAARLRADVTASIGSIPEIYVEDFSGLVNEIQAQIPPCIPPPIRREDENGDDDDDGKRKKDKKDKKDKHDRDDRGEDEDRDDDRGGGDEDDD
jgi:hypothetical protein